MDVHWIYVKTFTYFTLTRVEVFLDDTQLFIFGYEANHLNRLDNISQLGRVLLLLLPTPTLLMHSSSSHLTPLPAASMNESARTSE